ncbi:MAG: hypothetical protein Athens101428_546 [Candidatus Berkelbacteria bacterium Athens1014_28]|uniref:Uncharacterized protein n=1 Tax=Candidatus Berkelbacteria bacterium Athens1014_28 TaxID=2017145 RepID=A0A554LMA1_9BACT|nr:MAG: hypothetical protein Athens101428_546 [Candidatus Berkelbacteria bacterium Athens1014_28]
MQSTQLKHYFITAGKFVDFSVLANYKLTIILFLAVIFLAYICDYFLSQSIFGRGYRYFLAPGVIVHEFAHGFACLFTGAKVTEMFIIYFVSIRFDFFDIDLSKYGYSVKGAISTSIDFLKNLPHFSLKNWVLFYLLISIAVTMLPSRKDITSALVSIIIVTFGIFLALKYIPIALPVYSLNLLLFSTVGILIIFAVFSIVVFALTNVFRR